MSRHLSRRDRAAGRKPGAAPTGQPTAGDAALAQVQAEAKERRRQESIAWEQSDEARRLRRPVRRIPSALVLALSAAAFMPPMVRR